MRQSLYRYSDNELSLIVFNTEWLYNIRHEKGFIKNLHTLYQATNKQIAVLKQDLIDDKAQMNNEVQS
jgi:hypothetical protein